MPTLDTEQRSRIVRQLIAIRWVVILALFFLQAYLTQSIAVATDAWRLMLYILGAYALVNIFLRVILAASDSTARAGAARSVAILGFLGDVGFISLFIFFTPLSFRPLSFALYILPLLEAAALFGDIALILVFFLVLALANFFMQNAVDGEVVIEKLVKLVPQNILLLLVTLFASTTRKSLQQQGAELTHSRRFTEMVVDNLPDGILILDEEHRVLFVNKSAETILAVKAKEVVGLKVHTHLAYPVKNAANLLKVVGATASGGDGPVDVQLEHPEERLLKAVRLPLQESGGEIRGQMIVCRDVTRDAMFNKLKSDFISVAAHQLRTPLSSIKWAFAMLKEGGLGPLTEDQKPVVDQGLSTTDRLVRLVNSLLNISRIEEGRFGYEFTAVDPRLLVDKVVSTLQAKAASRTVSIRAELPAALPQLAADQEKIELVLENIVDNAVSYTQSGGEVLVRVAPEGKFVRFTVQDNGVGIPASQLPFIYAKFFRGDNVVRMQTEGSGLGLYIARNIVERHGGVMTLTSEEGRGTAVSFTVPIA